MIVVVEGIDRVGKTTLAKKLEDRGFIYLKDEFVLPSSFKLDSFADYSLGKCDSFIAIAKKLNEEGKHVVIDRLHLTELVYGDTERCGNTSIRELFALDMILAGLDSYLCYIYPEDIEFSNREAGVNQQKRHELFGEYIKLSSMRVISSSFSGIDSLVEFFEARAQLYNYDFYFASPFFNPEQVEREERMIAHLRGLGFKVFSPKEACHLDAKASQQSRQDVFKANCDAIKQSRAVFAVTDGKDMGTIWEAGYAYGINKPVIYFAETLGGNKFNLMLAESGRDVYLSQDEVTYNSLVDSMTGVKRNYRGDIE